MPQPLVLLVNVQQPRLCSKIITYNIIAIPVNLRIQILIEFIVFVLWISRLRWNHMWIHFGRRDFEWHARYFFFRLFVSFTPATRAINEEKDNHAKKYSTANSHENKHWKEKKRKIYCQERSVLEHLILTVLIILDVTDNSLRATYSSQYQANPDEIYSLLREANLS